MQVSTSISPINRVLYLLPLALGLITLSALLRESSKHTSSALFLLSQELETSPVEPDSSEEIFTIIPTNSTDYLSIRKSNKGFIHLDHSEGYLKRKFWLDKGIHSLPITRLPSGVYLLWASEWDKRTTYKVVIP